MTIPPQDRRPMPPPIPRVPGRRSGNPQPRSPQLGQSRGIYISPYLVIAVVTIVGLIFGAIYLSSNANKYVQAEKDTQKTIERLVASYLRAEHKTVDGRRFSVGSVDVSIPAYLPSVPDHLKFTATIVHGGGGALRVAGQLRGEYDFIDKSLISLQGELSYKHARGTDEHIVFFDANSRDLPPTE